MVSLFIDAYLTCQNDYLYISSFFWGGGSDFKLNGLCHVFLAAVAFIWFVIFMFSLLNLHSNENNASSKASDEWKPPQRPGKN